MQIGGFQKLSLQDFPGKVSAIIFTMGCNFHCPFCFNKSLVNLEAKPISESYILNFLRTRKGLLDGVVITGGEPTLQTDLKEFLTKLKLLNYAVKLDTNGSNPQVLKDLIHLKLIDYVAMDVKTSLTNYKKVGAANFADNVLESINIIKNSRIDHEFRTTVVPTIVEENDLLDISKILKGAKRYFLQHFQHASTLDQAFENVIPYSSEDISKFKKEIESNFAVCKVR